MEKKNKKNKKINRRYKEKPNRNSRAEKQNNSKS
jgi:hypothetical protein